MTASDAFLSQLAAGPAFVDVGGSLTAINTGIGSAIDAAKFVSVAVQITGTFSGTATFQVSLDGTNWVTKTLVSQAGASASSATAAGSWSGDIGARYFRVQMTAYTSGTAVVTVHFLASSTVGPLTTVASTQSGTWTVTQTTPSGTTYSLTTAATTNAASIKTTAGNLFELTISNPTATAVVVKLYNKASAPTVGTDVPVVTIPAPAGSHQSFHYGNNGKRFATGIASAVTANAVATDTTAAVAGVQVHGTYV